MYVGGRKAKSAPQIAISSMRPAGTISSFSLYDTTCMTQHEGQSRPTVFETLRLS